MSLYNYNVASPSFAFINYLQFFVTVCRCNHNFIVLFPGRPDPARAFFGTARAWLEHIRPETARLETGPGRLRAARNWPGPFRAGLSSGLGLMARAGSGQKARIIFYQF